MDEPASQNSASQNPKDINRAYFNKNGKQVTAKELIKSIRGRIQRTLRRKAENKSKLS